MERSSHILAVFSKTLVPSEPTSQLGGEPWRQGRHYQHQRPDIAALERVGGQDFGRGCAAQQTERELEDEGEDQPAEPDEQ